MTAADLVPQHLAIAALAAGYRAGAFTPADVVAAIADRIDRRGDDAVWITVDPIRAAGHARALGGVPDPDRPLWGIPFAVKDNVDVADWPTTAAFPGFARVASVTATAVQRVVDAGAILIGKTNLDQFATGLNGTRSPYGIPRSAADPQMISGGSSSGSAVAVATGLVSFALGTDTAGSGRVPAALNGVVGHKPSRGLVSGHGVVPACRSLDCVSVFATTVQDAVDVVTTMAGTDPNDPWTRRLPSPRILCEPDPAALRLGVPRHDQLQLSAEHGYDRSWDELLTTAAAAGVELVEVDLTAFFDAGRMLYGGPWLAERAAAIRGLVADPDALEPPVRAVLADGAAIGGESVFHGIHRLREFRARAGHVLSSVDALLMPTVETTFTVTDMLAEPVARNAALGRFTTFANLLDLCAVAVPVRAALASRPFGVTVAGTAGSDAQVAAIAGTIEALARGDAAIRRARPVMPAGGPARLPVAVVGAHLAGMPLHHELRDRNARLLTRTRTAAEYRLVALRTEPPKPGLIHVGEGGAAIEVEVYELPVDEVGGFLAGILPPLGIGPVRLADGAEVHGFVCDPVAAAAAEDISAHGGWRAYREASRTT